MPRPKHLLQKTAEITASPPDSLAEDHKIARVIKATGNNLYSVTVPASTTPILVELPSKFRNLIWIKRGGYVVVDTTERERDNKISGEIVNVVREQKGWMKMPYWPKEFVGREEEEESDEEDSRAGKMPSSDEED
ncbi:nucleic acid-binding protein [Pseudovirgaria hyperparasitica]|uniref:Nucleic acid-binding protein n=1 Tax=Pseudovirgaria hyperparasitica TaxID=470096 RepID=A0A6A6W1I9_9PEZI|nr:nucleic acid-binding protein [Pseudovirgaria hyperparasitica]KAF2755437.1 nucleic acid-binding protein [Pseudovirgaria hyperparasitica]